MIMPMHRTNIPVEHMSLMRFNCTLISFVSIFLLIRSMISCRICRTSSLTNRPAAMAFRKGTFERMSARPRQILVGYLPVIQIARTRPSELIPNEMPFG